MTGYTDDLVWLLILAAVYALATLRRRDYYVVVREFRIVEPNEFGKGQRIESRHVDHFDDYSAASAFFNLHESYGARPSYENQQQINYVYAVTALTAKTASAKMAKRAHHEIVSQFEISATPPAAIWHPNPGQRVG